MSFPEFVDRINYDKGVLYYAANGDFSSAAAAHLFFYKVLPQDFVTLEGGMYGFGRGVFGMNQKLDDGGNLVYGGEIFHDNGPWVHSDDYLKANLLLTPTARATRCRWLQHHRARLCNKPVETWNSSDQIPEEAAVTSGQIPFFGEIDPGDGGNSQRYSLQAEWYRADENSSSQA